MALSNAGDHKGNRQLNYWKKNQLLADTASQFQEELPFLNGKSPDLPQFSTSDNTVSANNSGNEFNLVKSYSETVPATKTINDIVLKKYDAGEAPKYDEAQKARLQKQAKIAAVGQAFQGIAGILGLSQGVITPFAESEMGASAVNKLNELDANYYNELAKHRDLAMKAHFANIGAENEASMNEWKARQQAIADQKDMDFRKGINDDNNQLRWDIANLDKRQKDRQYNLDLAKYNSYNASQKLEAIRRYEAEYDDLAGEYEAAVKGFDTEKAAQISKQMSENMQIRRVMMSQQAQNEGFTFDQPGNPQQPKKGQDYVDALQGYFGAALGGNNSQNNTTQSTQPTNDTVTVRGTQVPRQDVEIGVSQMIQQSQGQQVTPDQRNLMIEGVMALGYSEDQATKYIDSKIGSVSKNQPSKGQSTSQAQRKPEMTYNPFDKPQTIRQKLEEEMKGKGYQIEKSSIR